LVPTVSMEKIIDVPPEKVWTAASRFSDSPWLSFPVVIKKTGDPALFGAGTERIVTIGGSRVYERLEAVEPPHSFAYRILSGSPVKDYLGKAEFSPVDSRTRVIWSATFVPLIPGTAWIVRIAITGIINKIFKVLESIE